MRFKSISGHEERVNFRTALFRGTAPDGSLYVPEYIPRLPDNKFHNGDGVSLQEFGLSVAASFITDIPTDHLREIVTRSLNFPIPLVPLEDNLYLLELFHGPTLAFKDIGARFMAEILDYYLRHEERLLKIIVATSGDTGSAVAHGFFGATNISVYILYPSGKVSPLQEKQMTTLGGNICAVEVEGVFDDCQRLVKQALTDKELQNATEITTANSINLGRLLPQITYYLWAYAQWKSKAVHHSGEPVFVVPSGNFGNLTAALYAKQMGMPTHHCIAATNVNDVVPAYLLTGVYTPRASVQTLSNAMDVGNPSNWSRIEALYGHDIEAIRQDLSAVAVTDEETIEEMRETYRKTGYLLDPHTAVGVRAARRTRNGKGESRPYIVAATAHPAKFKDVIEWYLSIEVPIPQSLAKCMSLPKQSIRIKATYDALRDVIR